MNSQIDSGGGKITFNGTGEIAGINVLGNITSGTGRSPSWGIAVAVKASISTRTE
jgi:hypothetical protein